MANVTVRGRRCDTRSGRSRRTRADCRTIWIVHAMIGLQPPRSSPTAGHTRPRVQKFAMPSGKSATDVELKALHRTYDIKRKASEIQESVATHKERTRRIANEHARAEGHVNDGIGSLGQAVQSTATATHSLTCGVPDRESNEVKYLREATELIETWQHQLLS